MVTNAKVATEPDDAATYGRHGGILALSCSVREMKLDFYLNYLRKAYSILFVSNDSSNQLDRASFFEIFRM